jgi:DNA-binding SARP family transcriptional activator
MKFKVLGSLEIAAGENVIRPSAPKQRTVLALLLASSNEVVSTGALIDELWADRPPLSAQTTLQTYIYHLRKTLGDGDGGWAADNVLLTRHGGYRLVAAAEDVDLAQFERLAAEGRVALDRGELSRASETLRRALALWRGPALADVATGPRLETHRVRLEEARMHVTEMRIESELRMGRHRELIGDLKQLAATHRLNEWFHLKLMTALSRAGRRQEALEVYTNLRRVLIDELGVEPDHSMRQLQHQMLTSQAV